jgi:hypothetical protein
VRGIAVRVKVAATPKAIAAANFADFLGIRIPGYAYATLYELLISPKTWVAIGRNSGEDGA